jgi:hypothetical protein
MSKRLIIEQAEALLIKRGFKQSNWIVSLQGPTVIFTEEGLKKYEEDQSIKEELLDLGIRIFIE